MTLTTEQKRELINMLGNTLLMDTLREIWAHEATYQLQLLQNEALNGSPSVALIIEHSARSAEAKRSETLIKAAIGL